MATGGGGDGDTASYDSSSSSSSEDKVLISKKHHKKLQMKHKEKESDVSSRSTTTTSATTTPKSAGANNNKGDHICGICEKDTGGDLSICTGSCVSAFHLSCLPANSNNSNTANEAQAQDQWKCPSCVANTHICFHCKQLGIANGDLSTATATTSTATTTTAGAAPATDHAGDAKEEQVMKAVVKCRALSCGKYYHHDCIAKLPLARIAGTRFICPLHTCGACEQSGAKKEPVRCMRCPVAYHMSCLPSQGVAHLPGKRIICPKHDVTDIIAGGGRAEEDDGATMKKPPAMKRVVSTEDGDSAMSIAASSPRTEENDDMDDDAKSDTSMTTQDKKSSKKEKKDKKKKKKKRKKEKKKDKEKERGITPRGGGGGGGDADQVVDDGGHGDGEKEEDAKVKKNSKSSVKSERHNEEEPRDDGEKKKHQVDGVSERSSSRDDHEAATRGGRDTLVPSSQDSADEAPTVGDVASGQVSKTDQLIDQEQEREATGAAVSVERDFREKEDGTRSTDRPADPEVVKGEQRGGDEQDAELVVTTTVSDHGNHHHHHHDNAAETADFADVKTQGTRGEDGDGEVDDATITSRGVNDDAVADGAKDKHVSTTGTTHHSKKSKKSKRKGKGSGSGSGIAGLADAAKRSGSGDDDNQDSSETTSRATTTTTAAAAAEEAKWVQCDECKKWRIVPKEIDLDAMPEKWFCKMNSWNKSLASCSVPEEIVEAKKNKSMKRPSSSITLQTSGDGGRTAPALKKVKLGKQTSATDAVLDGSARPSDLQASEKQDKDKAAAMAATTAGGKAATKKAEKDAKKRKLKLKLKEKYGEVKWVQCENAHCGKWRVVPLSIDFDLLPAVWTCDLNTWSLDLASCAAGNPPEVEAYLSKSQSKKRPTKKLKGASESGEYQGGGAAAGQATATAQVYMSASELPVGSKANTSGFSKAGKQVAKGSAPSGGGQDSVTASAAFVGAGGHSSANLTAVSSSHSNKAMDDGRGGGRKAASSSSLEGVKSVVLEWAQCEKCNKWRKLPAHIKSSTLPDKWYCTMNHWDPSRASCATPQEEDQEPVDASPLPSSQNWYPMPGQVGTGSSTAGGVSSVRSKRGKLSYSELLYASTGQLRKTYTSESSTLSFEYEGVTYHRDDQYKNSSLYVAPLTTNKLTGEQIEPQSDTTKVKELVFSSLGQLQQDSPLLDSVKQWILDKIDLKREYAITEIVDSVVNESVKSGFEDVVSLGVITTAMAQLVSQGVVEKTERPHAGGLTSSIPESLEASVTNSTTALLRSLSSQPAYYRKVPKRPLKALKAWKTQL